MRLRQLIRSLGDFKVQGNFEDFPVAGISCNSKAVGENFVFTAVKGSRQDGGRFIDEAVKKGARAVVAESAHKITSAGGKAVFIKVKNARKAVARLAAEFYGNPSSRVKVVGITGTNGKTTITYLLEALLKEAGANPAVIGTVNYRFNGKAVPSKNTTPGPVELQSMLSGMSQAKVDYCLMEVSSHALDQERAAAIDFQSAVFTNLTQDHLDYHKTLENYFKSKARLFEGLGKRGFALINCDDSYGRRLKKMTKAKVITYALEKEADITAQVLSCDCQNTRIRISSAKVSIELNSPLIGKHNVYNVLAAVSWGINEGIYPEAIKKAIEEFSLVPGRLEKVACARGFSVFVDYAHTPDALKNTLRSLKPLAKKRLIVVFGCGGERDKTKRPKMGRAASELSDYALITSDNPRSEDPRKIIEDIRAGVKKDNFCVIPERRKAIEKSLVMAEAGDIVLVAGKGHESYQILKDRVLDFDDRKIVKECLASMS